MVEVTAGPCKGVRGVVLVGAGRDGKLGWEAIRVEFDPAGRLGRGVIERFDPAVLKEVDPDQLPAPVVLP
jgi:hypothetical protein